MVSSPLFPPPLILLLLILFFLTSKFTIMKNVLFAAIGLLFLFTLPSTSTFANGHILAAGESLLPGQQRQSTNGIYRLLYQHDGNLVLYKNGNQALWHSKTHGKSAGKVEMRYSGELVILNAQNVKIWSSNTNRPENRGSRVIVQNDGNLVIYSRTNEVLWFTGTIQNPPNVSNVLQPGAFLKPGEKLLSPNGRYQLIYQHDGNLVLYRPGNLAIWSTRTNGQAAGKCLMNKSNGNLILFTPNNRAIWSTQVGSNANRDSRLVLQNDGNLVIYRPNNTVVWSTQTQETAASK